MVLLSDAIPGSGEGLAGIIDTDVIYDELGIPYIPAKRLKGILRESAEELAHLGAIPSEAVQTLFGQRFMKTGASLTLSNGYPEGYQSACDGLRTLIKEKPELESLLHPQHIIDCFTRLRSQTALGENGIINTGSLRTYRVLNKKLKFVFQVDFPDADRNLIEKLCKVTRSFGISRTRGFGEIRLVLESDPTLDLPSTAPIHSKSKPLANDKLCQLELQIRNESELLTSHQVGQDQSSESFIPGSVILGAFANRYIRIHRPDVPDDDPLFRRLFVDNKVQFLHAYPVKDHRATHPCPLSVVRKKDSTTLYDLANDDARVSVLRDEIQTKGSGGTFVCVEDDYIFNVDVESRISYHHRRPDDKALGRAAKSSGTGETDGVFFQFEVIPAGYTFKTVIKGRYCDLIAIEGMLQRDPILFLGKSRNAQYGKCRTEIKGIAELPDECIDDERLVLTLISDTLVLNELGHPSASPADLLNEINATTGLKLTLECAFVKPRLVGGFMSIWGLSKLQMPALKAGSVLVVHNPDTTLQRSQIESHSWGQRTSEGFGQIRVNLHGDEEQLEPGTFAERSDYREPLDSTLLSFITSNIVRQSLENEVRHQAIKHAKKTTVPASFISRLMLLIKSCGNWEQLQRELEPFKNKKAGDHYKSLLARGAQHWLVPLPEINEPINHNNFDTALHNLVNDRSLLALAQQNTLLDETTKFELYQLYTTTYLAQIKYLQRSAG
jgi:CRISPR-associated protein Csx10